MIRVRIRFLLLFIISIAFAYLDGGRLYYRIFYGFAATLVLSVIIVVVNRFSLNIDIKFESNIYSAGDTGKFTIFAKNRSIIPISYLTIMNSTLGKLDSRYHGDVINLASMRLKNIKYECQLKNRGVYNFGDMKLELFDIASIAKVYRGYTTKAMINVYPRIYSLNSYHFKGLSIYDILKANKSGIEDSYTIRENRKYIAGDNIKKINWKVSAKYNELFVKNQDVISGEEFNIFLNMNKENYQYDKDGVIEEQLVDLCCSIIHALQNKSVITKLFINSEDLKVINIEDKKDFQNVMEFFMNTKSDSDIDIIKFLNIVLSKESYIKNIAIITAELDTEFTNYVIDLEGKKKNIIVFYNVMNKEDTVNAERLKRLGVAAINISQVFVN